MLRPIDRRFAAHLQLWSRRFKRSFGDFIAASNLVMSCGGTALQTGVPSELLLDSKNYKAQLSLDGMNISVYPHDRLRSFTPKGSFAKLFGGKIVFIPRHMNQVLYIEDPVGFVSTFNGIYAADPATLDAGAVAGHEGHCALSYLRSRPLSLCAFREDAHPLIAHGWKKGDLESVPFPFENLKDAMLQGLEVRGEDEITRLVRREGRAGRSLRPCGQ